MENKINEVEWVTGAEIERLMMLLVLSADEKGVPEEHFRWAVHWVEMVRFNASFVNTILSGKVRVYVGRDPESGQIDFGVKPASKEWQARTRKALRIAERRLRALDE